jgi:hypothetical protein
LRATVLLAVFAAIFVGGMVLSIGSVVLPDVTSSQTLVSHGPVTPYGVSSYQISGYFLPPIPQGQSIDINVSGYLPGTIGISLFPSGPDSLSPTGSPILFLPVLQGPYSHVTLTSTGTQAYGLLVTSLNRSSYDLVVTSVWSPYYVLRVYLPEGIFLMILGAVGVINFRESRRREAEVRKVLAEVAARKSESGKG